MNLIEARSTKVVDTPGQFPHLQNAPAIDLGCGKMQRGEFCDRVTHRVIDSTFAQFPTMNVSNWKLEHECGDGRCQQLEPVTEQDYDLRLEFGESICKSFQPVANRGAVASAGQTDRAHRD